MTYEDLRNRVKEIMTTATRTHCTDVSIVSDSKWVTNKLTFNVGCIPTHLPFPLKLEEHIKFIYKEETYKDGNLSSIILIHIETVDYDGMLIVPAVQIKLETPRMTPEEYHKADNARREELHCTYYSGCDHRISIKDAIALVAHEKTKQLLRDIYDEVIKT